MASSDSNLNSGRNQTRQPPTREARPLSVASVDLKCTRNEPTESGPPSYMYLLQSAQMVCDCVAFHPAGGLFLHDV